MTDERVVAALERIERKFGVGSIQRLGAAAAPTLDVLPSGLSPVDELLGIGGWPRGRICEVFGPSGSGVTTLLLHALAAAQERGGIAALIDVDAVLDPEYARRIGCAVNDLFVGRPEDGAMALEIVDALVRSSAFDVIALDSVPALTAPVLAAKGTSVGAGGALGRAQLLSDGLRRLAAGIDRTRTVVLVGNRSTRSGSDNSDAATAGGRALRFYASIRLQAERRGSVLEHDNVAGAHIRLTAVKNKVAPPFRTADLPLMYGRGFAERTMQVGSAGAAI